MTIEEKLFEHREIKDMGYTTPCWLWTGGLHSKDTGYGRIYWESVAYNTHVLAAMIYLPNFNSGLLTCHKCDIPLCFNPEHLFQGTIKDNMRDMTVKGRHAKKRKTHCHRGHEFTPENTRMSGNHRCCRACDKINNSLAFTKY